MFKKIGAVSIMVLLLGVGCSADVEESKDEVVGDEIELVENKPEIDPVDDEADEVIEEIEETEEENVLDALTRADKIALAVSIMETDFTDTGTVAYDAMEDAIILTPTNEEFTNEVFFLMTGLMERDSWDVLVNTFAELSAIVSGMVDEDLKLAIGNPENEDRMILVVQNGDVLYNIADELED